MEDNAAVVTVFALIAIVVTGIAVASTHYSTVNRALEACAQ